MGLPLAGGALTLVVPHPIIARHTWRKTGQQGSGDQRSGFCRAHS
jgi:adenylate cyclase